jgi:WS/DGAT/MGAT family acyltransferase
MRLSSHDAAFLYTETASGPMHGVAVSVLDGAATFQEIFDYYAARIHLVPRLRQKLAFVPFNLAHPKWVDDPDFLLENHFKAHAVPEGTTVEQAFDVALSLGERLLDRSRPLWLTYVIEGVEGKTLLVQMSHHAFVDGATAVAMSTVLTDPAPDAQSPDAAPEWQPERPPSPQALWLEALGERARENAANAVKSLTFAADDAKLWGKGLALVARMAQPVMQAPWNAGLVGPKRKVATLEYTLGDFKAIRKALGGTVNDVVVSMVSEGAARYLSEKGEFVANQYLRLMCPVNVHSGEVDPTDLSGNRVSAMFPRLPAWPMEIEARLSAVRKELDGIKERGEAETMDALQHAFPNSDGTAMAQTLAVGTRWDPTIAAARLPAPVLPHFGPRPLQSGFNFACTNVPGPTWTQYVAGYEIVKTTGTMMLGGNLGLGVAVASINGVLGFGFTADPRLLPDVDRFAELVAEAFADLAKVAQADVLPDLKTTPATTLVEEPEAETVRVAAA